MTVGDMIKPFRFWCQKIVPLVYDDALSYYEVLCKVTAKLNEVIESYNNIELNLEEQLNQLAGDLQAQMAQYDQKLANLQQNVNNQIDALGTYVDNEIANNKEWVVNQIQQFESTLNPMISAMIQDKVAELESQIAQIQLTVSSNNYNLKLWVQWEIAKLIKQIPEITSVMTYSPVTSKLVPVQQSLDDLYGALRYFGLTAGQYAGLELTAEEYKNRGLMAWQYSLYGYVIFFNLLRVHKMHSTTTGKWTRLDHGIYQLANDNRERGLTANEYDTLALTVDQYDEMDLTAYAYDWEYKLDILTDDVEWKKEVLSSTNYSLEVEYSNTLKMVRPTHEVIMEYSNFTESGTGANKIATYSVGIEGNFLNLSPDTVFSGPYFVNDSDGVAIQSNIQIRYNSTGNMTTLVMVMYVGNNEMRPSDNHIFLPYFICYENEIKVESQLNENNNFSLNWENVPNNNPFMLMFLDVRKETNLNIGFIKGYIEFEYDLNLNGAKILFSNSDVFNLYDPYGAGSSTQYVDNATVIIDNNWRLGSLNFMEEGGKTYIRIYINSNDDIADKTNAKIIFTNAFIPKMVHESPV